MKYKIDYMEGHEFPFAIQECDAFDAGDNKGGFYVANVIPHGVHDELKETQAFANKLLNLLNGHEETKTRLYNLVNAAACLDGVGEPGVTYTKEDADNMLRLRIAEARETLKKVIG